MNKGKRNEIANLKYKKRLKIYNLKEGNYILKSHGVICSCFMCKDEKYRDKNRQKNKKIEFN